MWPMVLSIFVAAAVEAIERIERIARVAAVAIGIIVLTLTVVGPATWWGVLGIVPLAMGLTGW
jgi:hypothetical protein